MRLWWGGVSPNRCKDLTNGAEVLLNQLPLDGFPYCGQKSFMDALGKNMEERNWVFDAFEVRGDVKPDAEVPSLVPGGGVFLEYCR